MAENLEFTVDPAILYSIIQAQAGSLSKALLEGVMNSIDAGATSLTVELDREKFSMYDDGRGFQSRDEIEKWFGRFGTPHTEGDATYGRFRMGRGQLMAFAATNWRTGTFAMDVDVKNKGLTYDLVDDLKNIKGCRIEGFLYQMLSTWSLEDTIEEFKNLVRFAQIPVRLNGKVISTNPKSQKWDTITEDAYIQVDRDDGKTLKVYNLGVFVKEYYNYEFGCGGVVVSKLPLAVNFARNDILMSQCHVWARISDYVRTTNINKVATKGRLTDAERSFLARQYVREELNGVQVDPMQLKLITDITGRHHSISDLLMASRISMATDKQGRTGSQLHRQGSAFMLSQTTLSRFDVSTTAELLSKLEKTTGLQFAPAVDFDVVAADFSENYTTVNEDSLPPDELNVVRVLLKFHPKFYAWYTSLEKSDGIRQLRIGESNVAKAWTDGRTYVTLGRQLLKRAARHGAVGFMDLLGTLTHEYVHDSSDLESHDHDVVFYNKYHDVMQNDGVGKLLKLALNMEKAFNRLQSKGASAPRKLKSAALAPIAVRQDANVGVSAGQMTFEI